MDEIDYRNKKEAFLYQAKCEGARPSLAIPLEFFCVFYFEGLR